MVGSQAIIAKQFPQPINPIWQSHQSFGVCKRESVDFAGLVKRRISSGTGGKPGFYLFFQGFEINGRYQVGQKLP